MKKLAALVILILRFYVDSCTSDSAHPGYPQSSGFCGLQSDELIVDSFRLQQQIDELASFSDSSAPSVTRILYSEADVRARRYIKDLMDSSGLIVREDGVGNIFGRWEGSDSMAPAIATGSHTDAIPFSGKYDGVVGVLGAIEAINALNRTGFKPRRSLEVIMFTSEEPTRFGISCLGSRLLAGLPNMKSSLERVVDKDNISFPDAAAIAGYEFALETLLEVPLKEDTYAAFVELHIEQGPILEEEGIAIGIVTAIAAPASLKVDFRGDGGHAGAVLMPSRNDAGLAAAELALAVEKHVLETQSADTVGTTGVLELYPGAVNSIPSAAHIEIDIRDIDEQRRNSVIQHIKVSASEIATRRHVHLDFQIVTQDPPAASSQKIVKAIESASQQLGLTSKHMISRAYHDSLFMARVSPMGMIFIPCYRGYSHRPDEFASREDLSNGIKVLALSLLALSSDL
ncbi:hypothetical protein KP509_33G047900 [Ceratopteris richardii]|uniref:Peptidase M20 dimerisation domain-containing protein n=2 Tax=Ceratopteris richardii TaxID=49495 RepID=A0A8T2QQI1_CERRI|nr:hypothetical protein KP509_33G047900 [Ceratopteris richardii]